jgi:archaeoflavoprotein AfpA
MKAKEKKKVAWGITGAGDRLAETLDVMRELKVRYENCVEITIYLSKAGDQVLKWYKLSDRLKQSFDRVWVENNANSPFLAGDLQVGKFEFLVIAPASSNTVAKISAGICDSLLTNSAIMALKGFVPVYIMPTDYKEGVTVTRLPSGKEAKVRVRREDVQNVGRLRKMNGVSVLERPEAIREVFKKYFGHVT